MCNDKPQFAEFQNIDKFNRKSNRKFQLIKENNYNKVGVYIFI